MKSLYIICLAIAAMAYLPAVAATGNTVKGVIVDTSSTAVGFATVALTDKDNKFIKAVVCSADGSFLLHNVPDGNYILRISCIGYESASIAVDISADKLDLGKLRIKEGVEIAAVTVTAKRSLVRSESDKIVYDVENDPDAAHSSTMQILNKVPFVSVSPTGNNISVLGEEGNFTILVNGKKSLLLSESNQYAMKAFEASRLKKIELVTSPDGKYINNNAVINIVTKSDLPDGLIIDLNGYADTESSYGGKVNITSKVGKLIYNIGYGYGYSKPSAVNRWQNGVNNLSEEFRTSDKSESSNALSNSHKALFKASYDINKNNVVTLNASADILDNRTDTKSKSRYADTQGALSREFDGSSRLKGDTRHIIAGADYQHSFKSKAGRLLTVTYSYDNDNNKNRYDYSIDPILDYEAERTKTQNNLRNIENTAAVDFYNPINAHHSYFITAKYVHRDYLSGAWSDDLLTSPATHSALDGIDYVEQIASLSGNYALRLKKITLSAQLTADGVMDNIRFTSQTAEKNTSLKRNDLTLSPDVKFSYKPSSRSTIALYLNAQSFRPDIRYLNPYEDRRDPMNIITGNPDLQNEKSYGAIASYSYFTPKMLRLMIGCSYKYRDRPVYLMNYVDDAGVMVTTYDNIGHKNFLSFFSTLMLMKNKGFISLLNVSMAAIYQSYTTHSSSNSFWNVSPSATAVFRLGKAGSINCDVKYLPATFRSAAFEGAQNVKQHNVWMYSAGYGITVVKGLVLRVDATDFLDKYKNTISENHSEDYYSYSRTRNIGRTFKFSLLYTFGRFKDRVKTLNRAVRNTDREKND